MPGGSIEEVGSTVSFFFALWFKLRQKMPSFPAPEGSGSKAF